MILIRRDNLRYPSSRGTYHNSQVMVAIWARFSDDVQELWDNLNRGNSHIESVLNILTNVRLWYDVISRRRCCSRTSRFSRWNCCSRTCCFSVTSCWRDRGCRCTTNVSGQECRAAAEGSCGTWRRGAGWLSRLLARQRVRGRAIVAHWILDLVVSILGRTRRRGTLEC